VFLGICGLAAFLFFRLWTIRVLNNPNITVHFNTETVDIEGDDKGQMGGLKLRNTLTCEERSLPVRGLFYGIGHSPNSELLNGQVELDEASYVFVEPGTTNTSVEGVYAAGDLQVLDMPELPFCVLQTSSLCFLRIAGLCYSSVYLLRYLTMAV